MVSHIQQRRPHALECCTRCRRAGVAGMRRTRTSSDHESAEPDDPSHRAGTSGARNRPPSVCSPSTTWRPRPGSRRSARHAAAGAGYFRGRPGIGGVPAWRLRAQHVFTEFRGPVQGVHTGHCRGGGLCSHPPVRREDPDHAHRSHWNDAAPHRSVE